MWCSLSGDLHVPTILDLWNIEEVMTRNVHTIGAHQMLTDATSQMREFGLRYLPVISQGTLVGIVSESDLLRFRCGRLNTMRTPSLDTSGRNKMRLVDLEHTTPVEEVMTRPAVATGPRTTVGQTAHLMIDHKLGCVPIVDERRCVMGIVTIGQMLELLVERQWQLRGGTATSGKHR